MTPEEEFDAGTSHHPPSTGEAMLRGGVKGVTLGLSTPAAGGGAAAAAYLAHHAPSIAEALGIETRYPEELPTTKEAFQEAANRQAAADEEARKAHPYAFTGSQIVGGMIPGAVGGGAGLLRGVAQGAIQGGIAGAAEASPTADWADIGKGAGIGTAIGGPAGAIPSAISAIGSGVKTAGQRAGIRAFGLTGQQVRALAKQGDRGMEGLQTLLAEVPGDMGIRPFGNPMSNALRLTAAEKAAGQGVGAAVEAADQSAIPVLKRTLANRLQQQITTAETTPGVSDAYVNALRREAESVLRGPKSDFGPIDIHSAMKELQPRAQGIYNNVLGPGDRAAASAAADTRGVLKDILASQATGAGVGPQLSSANRVFGVLKSLNRQVGPRAAQEQLGNRTLALPATLGLLGGVGGAIFSSGSAQDRAEKALEMAAVGMSLRRGGQIAANLTALGAPHLAGPLLQAGAAPATRFLSTALGQTLAGRQSLPTSQPISPEDEFAAGMH